MFDAVVLLVLTGLGLAAAWFLLASDGEGDIVDEAPTLDTRNHLDD